MRTLLQNLLLSCTNRSWVKTKPEGIEIECRVRERKLDVKPLRIKKLDGLLRTSRFPTPTKADSVRTTCLDWGSPRTRYLSVETCSSCCAFIWSAGPHCIDKITLKRNKNTYGDILLDHSRCR